MRTFTKKKTMAGGAKLYKPWKEYAEGDYVIGTFQGTHVDNYQKTNIILEVVDCQFQNDPNPDKYIGKHLVINSCGTIDKILKDFEAGVGYQINYNGTSIIASGKSAHSVEVSEVEISYGEEEEAENDIL